MWLVLAKITYPILAGTIWLITFPGKISSNFFDIIEAETSVSSNTLKININQVLPKNDGCITYPGCTGHFGWVETLVVHWVGVHIEVQSLGHNLGYSQGKSLALREGSSKCGYHKHGTHLFFDCLDCHGADSNVLGCYCSSLTYEHSWLLRKFHLPLIGLHWS